MKGVRKERHLCGMEKQYNETVITSECTLEGDNYYAVARYLS